MLRANLLAQPINGNISTGSGALPPSYFVRPVKSSSLVLKIPTKYRLALQTPATFTHNLPYLPSATLRMGSSHAPRIVPAKDSMLFATDRVYLLIAGGEEYKICGTRTSTSTLLHSDEKRPGDRSLQPAGKGLVPGHCVKNRNNMTDKSA